MSPTLYFEAFFRLFGFGFSSVAFAVADFVEAAFVALAGVFAAAAPFLAGAFLAGLFEPAAAFLAGVFLAGAFFVVALDAVVEVFLVAMNSASVQQMPHII